MKWHWSLAVAALLRWRSWRNQSVLRGIESRFFSMTFFYEKLINGLRHVPHLNGVWWCSCRSKPNLVTIPKFGRNYSSWFSLPQYDKKVDFLFYLRSQSPTDAAIGKAVTDEVIVSMCEKPGVNEPGRLYIVFKFLKM